MLIKKTKINFREESMKKVLSIVLLAVVTLVSISLEATGRRNCNTGTRCCFPCVFSGAGTTELGQLENSIISPLPNLGFLGFNAQNYSRVKKCPIFEYNGIDRVTNQPFAQGDEAGIDQTIKGLTLFGGTLCLPNESDLCQNGGDLLNFPVVMDATVVITRIADPDPITALDLAKRFSGALGSVFVRSDRDGSTSFLTEYLAKSLDGKVIRDIWCIPAGSITCFGCGGFTIVEWAEAFPNGDPDNITPVMGPVAMMQEVDANPGSYGYIGWRDFQALQAQYPNVNVVSIEVGVNMFVEPTSVTIGNQLANLTTVPANLLIDTIGSNRQAMAAGFPSDAYPMASPANIVVRCCQFSKCQVIELRKFLYYLATVGQATAAHFELAPLSPEIISQYIKNLNLLQYSEDCIDNTVLKCCEC
jgi:ABC-type phosphate transport system substrate-binding protein